MRKIKRFYDKKGVHSIDEYLKWKDQNPNFEIDAFRINLCVTYIDRGVDKGVDKGVDNSTK